MSWPTAGLEVSENGAFIRSQSVTDLPSSPLGLTAPLRALFSLTIITISGGSLPLKGSTDLLLLRDGGGIRFEVFFSTGDFVAAQESPVFPITRLRGRGDVMLVKREDPEK